MFTMGKIEGTRAKDIARIGRYTCPIAKQNMCIIYVNVMYICRHVLSAQCSSALASAATTYGNIFFYVS